MMQKPITQVCVRLCGVGSGNPRTATSWSGVTADISGRADAVELVGGVGLWGQGQIMWGSGGGGCEGVWRGWVMRKKAGQTKC